MQQKDRQLLPLSMLTSSQNLQLFLVIKGANVCHSTTAFQVIKVRDITDDLSEKLMTTWFEHILLCIKLRKFWHLTTLKNEALLVGWHGKSNHVARPTSPWAGKQQQQMMAVQQLRWKASFVLPLQACTYAAQNKGAGWLADTSFNFGPLLHCFTKFYFSNKRCIWASFLPLLF